MDEAVRRGTSVLNREHAPGWSIARLADEFGLDRDDVANRLREACVTPAGTRGDTAVYRLSDAALALTDRAGVIVEHLDKASAEAYSASRVARAQIVCAMEGSGEWISPEIWQRILAKHRALGRQLTEEELQVLRGAEHGKDGDR
jgi:hypothetical protein